MKANLSVDARLRNLLVPSVLACIIILAALFAASRLPSVLSVLAFVLLGLGVVAGFAARILMWLAHGIRRVELDGETMTILSGPALTRRQVQRASVLRLKVTSRLGRHVVKVVTRSGGRLRIAGDAFPEAGFVRLLDALSGWAR